MEVFGDIWGYFGIFFGIRGHLGIGAFWSIAVGGTHEGDPNPLLTTRFPIRTQSVVSGSLGLQRRTCKRQENNATGWRRLVLVAESNVWLGGNPHDLQMMTAK